MPASTIQKSGSSTKEPDRSRPRPGDPTKIAHHRADTDADPSNTLGCNKRLGERLTAHKENRATGNFLSMAPQRLRIMLLCHYGRPTEILTVPTMSDDQTTNFHRRSAARRARTYTPQRCTDHHAHRMNAVPGITGLAQTSRRKKTDENTGLDLNVVFVEQTLFHVDTCILARTLPAVSTA